MFPRKSMWDRRDKEGCLPSCVEFGMLVFYLNDLKDIDSKLNMKGHKQTQQQGDLKDIKFIV
jgi:hypothetical protein